jgi:hypothetical protein
VDFKIIIKNIFTIFCISEIVKYRTLWIASLNVEKPQNLTSNNNLYFEQGLCTKYVILLYIRVSVVLSRSLCRKEREKLDINLDSAVFVCRVKEI